MPIIFEVAAVSTVTTTVSAPWNAGNVGAWTTSTADIGATAAGLGKLAVGLGTSAVESRTSAAGLGTVAVSHVRVLGAGSDDTGGSSDSEDDSESMEAAAMAWHIYLPFQKLTAGDTH